MTKSNTLNVKWSSSQFNKLKSGIKNGAKATLKLSSNVIGETNDETNFPRKLLLTDTSSLHKAFANGSSANIKLSKTQLSKMVILGKFLVPVLVSTLAAVFKTGTEVVKRGAPILAKNSTKYFVASLIKHLLRKKVQV